MTTRTPHEGPVTFTLTSDEYHVLCSELVYVTSVVEAVGLGVSRSADPRRDAWVIAEVTRLAAVVTAADHALELLATARHQLR